MRALVIAHDRLSFAGHVGDRLAQRGVEIDWRILIDDLSMPHRVNPLPALDGYDLVVPLGAPWSVYDADLAHAVEPELELIREAARRRVPVLGVCFGAQALSAALGGTVSLAPGKEIGWVSIGSDPPDGVAPGPWSAWHQDRFTIPAGGV